MNVLKDAVRFISFIAALAIGWGFGDMQASAANPQIPPHEEAKIQALISHMESLKDAAFIRNGRQYKAEHAGRFLRGKRKAKADEIATAHDFIEKAASYSGTTGQPYRIRFKDGKEVTTNAYLKNVLSNLQVKG